MVQPFTESSVEMLRLFAVSGGLSFLVLAALFFGVLFSALIGAFTGWAVGVIFPATMSLASQMLGIEAEPWQLGVIFGFIGGFFRSHFQSKG